MIPLHPTAVFVVLMIAGCGALPQLAEPLPPSGSSDGEGAAAAPPAIRFRGHVNNRVTPLQVLAAAQEGQAQDREVVYAGDDSAYSVLPGVVRSSNEVSPDKTITEAFDNTLGAQEGAEEGGEESVLRSVGGFANGVYQEEYVEGRGEGEEGVLRSTGGFNSDFVEEEYAEGGEGGESILRSVGGLANGFVEEEYVEGGNGGDGVLRSVVGFANGVEEEGVSGAVENEMSPARQGRAGVLTSFNFKEDDQQASLRSARQVCGVRRSAVPDVFTRIVGGSVAEKHEFPWQVSLQWRYSWYNYHVCGGAVLNANWVLTAAHCTHQFKPQDLIIFAGVHNIKHREGTEQRRDIDRVAEHWGYNPSTQENDIALLHVMQPLIIDGLTVAPVCLPPPGQFFSGDCVVSGWGKVSELGQSSDELRKVVVPIITREQCMESYRVIGYSGPISEKMLCAGYNQGAKDACQGDSGGPFVCRGQDNRYTIAGVVSWGVGCARPNVPGVYTEVSRYTTWISGIVHGRADATERRAASISTSLHLNDFFNISVEASDFEDNNGADEQRSEIGTESAALETAVTYSVV